MPKFIATASAVLSVLYGDVAGFLCFFLCNLTTAQTCQLILMFNTLDDAKWVNSVPFLGLANQKFRSGINFLHPKVP
jgi:hypothetical protein